MPKTKGPRRVYKKKLTPLSRAKAWRVLRHAAFEKAILKMNEERAKHTNGRLPPGYMLKLVNDLRKAPYLDDVKPDDIHSHERKTLKTKKTPTEKALRRFEQDMRRSALEEAVKKVMKERSKRPNGQLPWGYMPKLVNDLRKLSYLHDVKPRTIYNLEAKKIKAVEAGIIDDEAGEGHVSDTDIKEILDQLNTAFEDEYLCI